MNGRFVPHLPSTQRFCSHSPLLITSVRTKRIRSGGASGSNSTQSRPAPGGSAASWRTKAVNSVSVSIISFHVIDPALVTCTRLPPRKPVSGPSGMFSASCPSHPYNAIARNMRIIRIGIRYCDVGMSAICNMVSSILLPGMVACGHVTSSHTCAWQISRWSFQGRLVPTPAHWPLSAPFQCRIFSGLS